MDGSSPSTSRSSSSSQNGAARLRTALARWNANPLRTTEDVGAALARLQREALLDLPLPGAGHTMSRYAALIEIAACDLSLARLAEGHTDALAIAAELGYRPAAALYGVWAAEARDRVLHAEPDGAGLRLHGVKPYASGARTLGHALVTARTSDGPRLVDVDLRAEGVRVLEGSWPAVGMAGSDSLDVAFDDVRVPASAVIGGPNVYVQRPGFWHGSVGVAACWYGGAAGCLRMVRDRFEQAPPDEHAAAHLGAMIATARAMESVLVLAAEAIDRDPLDREERGRRRALETRAVIEAGGQEILQRCGRASGTSPLVFDESHARRAADLVVYLRQHHAERDLAALGRLALEGPAWP